MKKITLLLMLNIFINNGLIVAQISSALTINANTKYQKITGFGAVGMYSSSISGGWQNYITANQIDSLYGPNGIGLNIFRVSIPYSAYSASGNNWFTYCNTAPKMNNMVDAIKRVKLYGGLVLASPWSPPLAFKDTLSKGGWYYGTASNYDFKTTLTGGAISYRNYNTLLDARYADYATFLNSFVTYMNSQSAPIDIISVQNEPDYVLTDAACYWTGTQLLKFVKEQGTTIKGTTGVKLMAGETTAFDASKRTTYTDPILNDATAKAVTDIVAGHVYGNGADIDYSLARNAGKEVWMTEHAFGSSGTSDPTWADEILFASEIHDCMALGNYNAYMSWYPRRYYSLLNDGTYNSANTGKYTKRAYVMAQFAKHLTGKTHVKTTLTTSDANLQASAYINSNADTVAIIVINGGNSTHNLTVTLPFSSGSAYKVVTNASINLVQSNVTLSNTLSPVLAVPAQSITTFVFSKLQLATNIDHQLVDSPESYIGNLYSIDGRMLSINITSKKDLMVIKPGVYLLNKRKIILPLLK